MAGDQLTVGNVVRPDSLVPAAAPTLYFIGVTTGHSMIQRVFPRWARHLGLTEAVLCGIDIPVHAPVEPYREVVEFIKRDPLSLGALVTTHKIDLFHACEDQFDVIDQHARLMSEVSCLSKQGDAFVAHAKDPISSGLALEAFVPAGHWADSGAEVLSMGAGGSTIALSWYLSQTSRGADRPARIIVSNRSAPRLATIAAVRDQMHTDTPFEFVLAPHPAENSNIVDRLPEGSLVINATGLGKDAPGSPLAGTELFPRNGLAWDLNYRGDLVFLDQARSQAAERDLVVEDGWIYFLHGWTQVVAEVFHIDIPTHGPQFDALAAIATNARD